MTECIAMSDSFEIRDFVAAYPDGYNINQHAACLALEKSQLMSLLWSLRKCPPIKTIDDIRASYPRLLSRFENVSPEMFGSEFGKYADSRRDEWRQDLPGHIRPGFFLSPEDYASHHMTKEGFVGFFTAKFIWAFTRMSAINVKQLAENERFIPHVPVLTTVYYKQIIDTGLVSVMIGFDQPATEES